MHNFYIVYKRQSFKYLCLIFLWIVSTTLTGCARSIEPEFYKQEKPVFDVKNYFNGTIDAWGFFQDRSGKVVKRFNVIMMCTWKGNTGTLDENFTFPDGTSQHRTWTLQKNGDDYTGTAADVVGTAVGRAAGNALHWHYTLSVPVNGTFYEVQLNDWMYLLNDQIMLNRAEMSKFNFKVGELFISFRKRTP